MRPRTLVCITVLALCHLQLTGQTLTNGLPPAQPSSPASGSASTNPAAIASTPPAAASDDLPDDPDQQLIPIAQREPAPSKGIPVIARADQQAWAGNIWTGTGNVEFQYRGYVLHADTVTYDRSTSELTAEGHLEVAGGPEDVLIHADHGDMRLDLHTGRFYKVTGSEGVRRTGQRAVYSTTNPFLFAGRVLIQTGEGNYRIVDGSMTNCRLPKPDWRLISHVIDLTNGEASARNTFFELFRVPLFYIPYVQHPVDETGRESGFLIPVVSNSSIKGFVIGEQFYWAINRSMDMVVGSEYYSKRGWAPNGDFRYKGTGLDSLLVRWNALLDRGVEQAIAAPAPAAAGSALPLEDDRDKGADTLVPAATELVNQGGVDLSAQGRKDLSPQTRLAGNIEYLSSYVYRLVFNDNYSQAISSEVASDVSLTHQHNGFIPSVALDRFQTFASSTKGDEARILRLPSLRYDVLSQPLGASPLYWSFGSSLAYLSRSEPGFHARNVGRVDFYPHLSLPFSADGWRFVPEVALRDTFYTGSQTPDLSESNGGTPTISHESLNRNDLEASLDIRPPAIERDFDLGRFHNQLRHVLEPELTYRYVGGIGARERNVLLVDTTDIATNTNELEFSLTQRFYLRPTGDASARALQQSCPTDDADSGEEQSQLASAANTVSASPCAARPRQWASWQLAEKFFFNPTFSGAIIPGRRNVFASTLDLTGVAFLTDARNLSPLISRMRFEAVNNLRIEWDVDFDPKSGRLESNNLFAGYSWGNTTLGIGHAMLNAVDESNGAASTIQSQQIQPFLTIGKQSGGGLNFAANAGYDFVQHQLQYGGMQAVYNWNCCGLTVGYRRFELGSIRDETQYLYSFTLANFGSVGDIRRSNSIFRDPSLPPPY
jgi:LPS-assembly protein